MSLHQKFSLPAYEFHPELGYLCPSRQLRQNVRVGLTAAAFGIITGVAGAVALFPRHDLARTEPVLAVAPVGPVGDSTPLTASSPSIAPVGATSGTAERVSTGGVVKQSAAAPMGPALGAANETSPGVEPPAQPAPVFNADRGTAGVGGSEQVRAAASKKKRNANSSARRRWREPHPPAAFATSPFGFQTDRSANDARTGRRRDWGDNWGDNWRW
jgi:hypothetical protein